MYRVENKFHCSAEELYYLQKRLSYVLYSDSHENNVEGYKVSSIYFDDLKDTCLRDTIEGYNRRRKYRIRIYNDSFDTIKLEVKEKLYNRVYKRSTNITEEEMNKLLHGERLKRDFAESDPIALFNTAIAADGLRPKVIVTYERKAFVFGAGNVRITLDRHIRGCNNIAHFGKKDEVYHLVKGWDSVMEVKYDEFVPQFILQLLELGNLQQTAYSKYNLCRELY